MVTVDICFCSGTKENSPNTHSDSPALLLENLRNQFCHLKGVGLNAVESELTFCK